MATDRKDLLAWLRDYCKQDFYGDTEEWANAKDYTIGDLVIGTNDHVYKAKSTHTSNNDSPPTNTTLWDYTEEYLPGGIKIALDKAVEFLDIDVSKQSESLGDYSVTYSIATNWGNFPPHIRNLLRPYRRVGFA